MGENMRKKKVLFVCVHNSARSVMTEAFMNQLCGDYYEAESAGLEPGTLNPLVKEVMAEIGIDVSEHKPRAVSDVIKSGETFAHVITVCDETAAERCPIFPGMTERLHWGFPDPSALQGPWDKKLSETRKIRDQIRDKIESDFCPAYCR
jgi:arsenate reductase (thioredoxin)